MTPLYEEFTKLGSRYDSIKLNDISNINLAKEFSNYDKIISFLQQTILTKIENIHATYSQNYRTKRGLINGLGTILKSISGNLDDSDGKKIYQILDHLKDNEKNLQSQIQNQYSVSHSLIEKFNLNVKNIMHNENALKSKIIQLNSIVRHGISQQNILVISDVMQQVIFLYNALLNTFEEIENSITFCKLGVLHPSIIKTTELFEEIKQISSHYKDQFPFDLTLNNILDFESTIK